MSQRLLPLGATRMYVIVRKYELAGKSEEVLRRAREDFLPVIRALPGFISYHVADCGGHSLMSIGFWESKVAARRSSAAAREWIAKTAIGLVPFPPETLEGDTVVDIGIAEGEDGQP